MDMVKTEDIFAHSYNIYNSSFIYVTHTHTCAHTHTHTHTHIYIYIYIYISTNLNKIIICCVCVCMCVCVCVQIHTHLPLRLVVCYTYFMYNVTLVVGDVFVITVVQFDCVCMCACVWDCLSVCLSVCQISKLDEESMAPEMILVVTYLFTCILGYLHRYGFWEILLYCFSHRPSLFIAFERKQYDLYYYVYKSS